MPHKVIIEKQSTRKRFVIHSHILKTNPYVPFIVFSIDFVWVFKKCGNKFSARDSILMNITMEISAEVLMWLLSKSVSTTLSRGG